MTQCWCLCRWNVIAAPQVHLTAQLLPMLLGFFTYKAAIVGRYGLNLLGEITSSGQPVAPVQPQQQQELQQHESAPQQQPVHQ